MIETDALAALIDDAGRMQLPRPRPPRRPTKPGAIDLVATEVRIPDATVSLVEAYPDYGS